MQSIIRLSVVFAMTLTITACEPEMFGIPQSQWQQLSKAQQMEVIRGYNDRKLIAKQNEPANNMIDAASGIIEQAQWNKQIRHHSS